MMNKNTKMWIAAGIVALMAGTGTALAATETPAAPSSDAAQTQDQVEKFDNRGEMKGGKFLMKGDHQALLDFLKITHEELHTAREAQKSLLDIATEKGISKDALVDFLLENHTKSIDQAVTDGKIDAEKAAEIKSKLTREQIEERISQAAPAKHDGEKGFGGPGKMMIGKNSQELLDFLKLTEEQLRTAMQADKTLLDVATDQGIEKDALVTFLLDSQTQHIDQAVTDGKIDAEKAAEMKTHLTREKIEAMISSKGPAFGKGGAHGGHHGKFRKGAPQDGAATTELPSAQTQVQQQSYEAL
ncbi:hypothetical protein OS242_13490 [Tumebacillus sp. DT12]|uniref:DUF5667 domain-containing protein n=1 Tax=Tumebacillus lacus TaxID=2995335 RepID=A0ABT3X4R0_9BACL|nr:hypothetical protein [Tumebacillus lacus]MCX7570957.1 hypothetical protein [Tumebacillus lacus]